MRHGPTTRAPLATVAVLTALLVAPGGIAALTPLATVALIDVPGLEGRTADLAAALEAHLSDLPITVLTFEPEPGDDPAEQADDLARRGEAVTALWLAEQDGLWILTPRLDAEPALRQVDTERGGWAAACEALAAVVRSELSALFAAEGPEGDEGEEEPEGDGEEGAGPVPETRLSGALGYAPAIASAGGPFLNGARLELGAFLGPHLGVHVGVDLLQRAHLALSGGGAELVQWPLRVTLDGILPLEPLEIGARGGAVINLWRIDGLGYAAVDAVDDVRASFAASLAAVVRYRVLPWLALWIEAGADIYFTEARFVRSGDTVLRRAAAMPRGAVGVVFLYEVSR